MWPLAFDEGARRIHAALGRLLKGAALPDVRLVIQVVDKPFDRLVSWVLETLHERVGGVEEAANRSAVRGCMSLLRAASR